MMVSEVNILRELRSPFVVKYYDRIVDRKATTLYLVMEHCAGGDLGDLIAARRRDGNRYPVDADTRMAVGRARPRAEGNTPKGRAGSMP
jgi:serine/threonine protein kinase